MALDRVLQLGLAGARIEFEIAVERVEAEQVPMGPSARRRTGPTVTDRAEVVSPLPGPGLALAQPARAWIKPPGDPVREDTVRRVRVVHEARQRARLLGDARPAKRGRDILTVAGEVLRDRLRVLERVALEGELTNHHILCRGGPGAKPSGVRKLGPGSGWSGRSSIGGERVAGGPPLAATAQESDSGLFEMGGTRQCANQPVLEAPALMV